MSVIINDNFVKTGNEVLNDVKYYFEEYTMDSDNSVLIRYYFDSDNNIKFIKAYKEDIQRLITEKQKVKTLKRYQETNIFLKLIEDLD